MFDWIFENIFSENIFPNEPENENNKIPFLMFSFENRNLILSKNEKARTKNVILNKYKNIRRQKINIS